ncbi:hypothetical protein L3X38_024220 [Prunus dulcis]|uniref:Uncharacterized protein n=1 Tax=Prunus dulcis TaxID=3755 RepID=A0AAD4Z588_PRUDU|nr:hypothetical protein L3X38_024220 [Prunus dulcis]
MGKQGLKSKGSRDERLLGCKTEEKMGRDGGVRLEIAGISGMRDDACYLDVCLWKGRKNMEEQSMKLKVPERMLAFDELIWLLGGL